MCTRSMRWAWCLAAIASLAFRISAFFLRIRKYCIQELMKIINIIQSIKTKQNSRTFFPCIILHSRAYVHSLHENLKPALCFFAPFLHSPALICSQTLQEFKTSILFNSYTGALLVNMQHWFTVCSVHYELIKDQTLRMICRSSGSMPCCNWLLMWKLRRTIIKQNVAFFQRTVLGMFMIFSIVLQLHLLMLSVDILIEGQG